ncbi:TetR/AcrR family transcriptional regulator [Haloechinothrix aidingensis]
MAERNEMTEAGRSLLSAASELFYREGINAVGVAAIADAAGVTKKTLYDCYGSKARLVAAYLEDRHERWWAYLQQRLAEATSPRTLVLYRVYLDHPALDLSRGCGFLNGAAELPAGHPGFAVIREHKSAVRRLLTDLVAEDRPDDPDPRTMSEQLFLLLEGAVAHRAVDGDTHLLHSAERIAEALLVPGRAGA